MADKKGLRTTIDVVVKSKIPRKVAKRLTSIMFLLKHYYALYFIIDKLIYQNVYLQVFLKKVIKKDHKGNVLLKSGKIMNLLFCLNCPQRGIFIMLNGGVGEIQSSTSMRTMIANISEFSHSINLMDLINISIFEHFFIQD